MPGESLFKKASTSDISNDMMNRDQTDEYDNSMNRLSSNIDEKQIAVNTHKETLEEHQRNVAALKLHSPSRGVTLPGGLKAAHHRKVNRFAENPQHDTGIMA